MDEEIDDALEINEFYELTYDRSGDNGRMFQEVKEQKCTHAIIRDCGDIIVKIIIYFNSVPFI